MNRRNFLNLSGITAATSMLALPAFASTNTQQDPGGELLKTLEVQWLGGATMLIRFDGVTVMTDPAFGIGDQAIVMPNPNEMFDPTKGPNIKPQPRFGELPQFNLESITATFVSHMHPDHFDKAAEAALPSSMEIISSDFDRAILEEKGFSNTTVLPWGEQLSLPTNSGKIQVTSVPAKHSQNPEILGIIGRGNGYFFEFLSGNEKITLYWTGDTFPEEDVMASVQQLGDIDILVPHVGAVGSTGTLGQISMGASHVVEMAGRLKPRTILPIHHSTFGLYLEPIWELTRAMQDHPSRLDVISEGTIVTYP
ncbi:MBL fold metallo-hydrolase [Pseudovibrio axinellae]|nr:MBL fold metallo-hydrolase [Pseudovibrio axinellae]